MKSTLFKLQFEFKMQFGFKKKKDKGAGEMGEKLTFFPKYRLKNESSIVRFYLFILERKTHINDH